MAIPISDLYGQSSGVRESGGLQNPLMLLGRPIVPPEMVSRFDFEVKWLVNAGLYRDLLIVRIRHRAVLSQVLAF
jgi:hypothetical protein